jgi:hypothetical protein
MIDYESVRDSAESALFRRDFDACVRASSLLVEAGEPWLLDGLVRRALALENWVEGPRDHLVLAAIDWRGLVDIAPTAASFVGLARVQLKMGDRCSALANFHEAERLGAGPEAWLGLAQCFGTASPADGKKSKAYYFRAAMRGSADGVRGYVDTAFALDQPFSAAAMTLFGLITAPAFALIRGWRRHSRPSPVAPGVA